jgi:hypothetical protein
MHQAALCILFLRRIIHTPHAKFLNIPESHPEHAISRLTAVRIDPFLNGRKVFGGISLARIDHTRSSANQALIPYLHLMKAEGRSPSDPDFVFIGLRDVFAGRITPPINDNESVFSRLCDDVIYLSTRTVLDKTYIILYLTPEDFSSLELFSPTYRRKRFDMSDGNAQDEHCQESY